MGALHLPAAPLTLSCSSMRGVLYPLDTGAGARCLLWGWMGGNGRKCVVNPNLPSRALALPMCQEGTMTLWLAMQRGHRTPVLSHSHGRCCWSWCSTRL